jgi:hypothetical protein
MGEEVRAAPSALSGLQVALKKAHGIAGDETPDELVVAAANDIGAVGRVLGTRDAGIISFSEKELPEALVRRPLECSLRDVAVGAGSVERTKMLLELHSATPTRGTLKQAISTGSIEPVKLVRGRLPETELRDRLDLLELGPNATRTWCSCGCFEM